MNVVKSISTADCLSEMDVLMFRFARRVLQYKEQMGISKRM